MAQVDATAEHLLHVEAPTDVERARRLARALASGLEFDRVATEQLVLAVSELATNLIRYAHHGEIRLRHLRTPVAVGIEVDCCDEGPGIADLEAALGNGASTGGGLGVGLGGVQRLMDEFEVTTGPTGTRVVCRKWRASA